MDDDWGWHLRGYDSAADVLLLGAEGGRVRSSTKLDGRDLYLRRLEGHDDYEPEEYEGEEDEDDEDAELDGRDAYVRRLEEYHP